MFLIKHNNTTTPQHKHNKILQCYDKDNIGEDFGGRNNPEHKEYHAWTKVSFQPKAWVDSETNAFGLSIQEDVLERVFAFTG